MFIPNELYIYTIIHSGFIILLLTLFVLLMFWWGRDDPRPPIHMTPWMILGEIYNNFLSL